MYLRAVLLRFIFINFDIISMRKHVLVIFAFLLLMNTVAYAYDSWWDLNWTKRIEYNVVEQSGNDLFDYQIAINVTYEPEMQPDFSDLRFTYYNSTNETELPIPYWIESKVNSSWAQVWVKVPYIPSNGDSVVYSYYGNPNATYDGKLWNNITHLGIYGGVFDYNISKMQGLKGEVVSLSGIWYHYCALLINGTVHCWGDWQYGDYTGGDAIQVAAGYAHTCVLRSNGTVYCWGSNDENQSLGYNGGDAIAVVTGFYHSCALLKNGNVVCWGSNDHGQAENYTGGDAIGLAAGGYHTCALLANGNVHCWGSNGAGESNDYTGGDAIAVTASLGGTCILLNNGNVICQGDDDYGELNNYTKGDAIAVALGRYHSCILRANGTVYCRGASGRDVDYNGGDAIGIVAGDASTCALLIDGNVHCWGADMYGETTDYTGEDVLNPFKKYVFPEPQVAVSNVEPVTPPKNITECSVIRLPGKYKLTTDLLNFGTLKHISGEECFSYPNQACIVIDSDDVVLDCANHIITGNVTAVYSINEPNEYTESIIGIKIGDNALNNITVVNCRLFNLTYPIFATRLTDNKHANMIFENIQYDRGLAIYSSENVSIRNIQSIEDIELTANLYYTLGRPAWYYSTVETCYPMMPPSIYVRSNTVELADIYVDALFPLMIESSSNVMINDAFLRTHMSTGSFSSISPASIYCRYSEIFGKNINSVASAEFSGDTVGIYMSTDCSISVTESTFKNYTHTIFAYTSDNYCQFSLNKFEDTVYYLTAYDISCTFDKNYYGRVNGSDGYSDTCVDSDADGICDTPYTISDGYVDYHPLSKCYFNPSACRAVGGAVTFMQVPPNFEEEIKQKILIIPRYLKVYIPPDKDYGSVEFQVINNGDRELYFYFGTTNNIQDYVKSPKLGKYFYIPPNSGRKFTFIVDGYNKTEATYGSLIIYADFPEQMVKIPIRVEITREAPQEKIAWVLIPIIIILLLVAL